MIQLKEVIHFYINSDILVSVKYIDNPNYTVWTKLTENRYRKLDDKSIEDTKYAFRRLEDMTEDEAVTLLKLSIPETDLGELKIGRHQWGNNIIIEWGVSKRKVFNLGDNYWFAEQFKWLCEKGFDLWDFIHYKQAFDIKSIIK